jgi:hypothetical protein
MPLKLRPSGLSSTIDKDRPGLHCLKRPVGCRPHLPDPRLPGQYALVLVEDRQRCRAAHTGGAT